MTTIEMEHKLSDAFSGGEIAARELRLTRDEADYLRTAWSAVCITPLSAPVGDKSWYNVQLKGVLKK